MEITEVHAKKFLSLLDHGLAHGLGSPEPGKACIEAVWCMALGLPHGDDPGCVMEPLRRLKIRLNDSRWSNNEARAKGMRRLGLIQVGSKDMDKKEFKDRVNRLRMQMIVPLRFRLAAKKQKTDENRKLLEDAALKLEQNPAREQCVEARGVANGVYNSAAAAYDAYDAADAADAAAAAYDAADAADKILTDFAEGVVQILIDMKAPGVKFLHLA